MNYTQTKDLYVSTQHA